MRSMARSVVVASFLAIMVLGLSAVQARSRNRLLTRNRLPTRSRLRIRSRAKAKISGDIRFTTASGGTGCLRAGGSTGATTDGMTMIPRLSLPRFLRCCCDRSERIDLRESSG